MIKSRLTDGRGTCGNVKARDDLEDAIVDRIILNCVWMKYDEISWTGLIRLMIKDTWTAPVNAWWTFGVIKISVISWLCDKLSASQYGVSSTYSQPITAIYFANGVQTKQKKKDRRRNTILAFPKDILHSSTGTRILTLAILPRSLYQQPIKLISKPHLKTSQLYSFSRNS